MNRYLKGIKESRREILNEIYINNYPPIRNFVIQNSGDEESAKDVFQDAMLSLYKPLQKRNIEITASFNVYIFNVGKYIWFNKLKKKNFSYNVDDVQLKCEIDDSMVEEQKYELFIKYFNQLGSDCQKVLNLYFDRKPFQEIAKIMSYKSDAFARRKKYLCKESLYNLVSKDPEFNEFY